MYDTIIIGGGPAGLTSAIYAKRAGLNPLVLERMFVGGQAAITSEIENFPGFDLVSGSELMEKMEAQARKFEVEIRNEDVLSLALDGAVKRVKTDTAEYESKTVILCMGAHPTLLGIPGESEYTGRGVSYCATCDGAFYRGKTVAVIGGGNTALEDALFLARTSAKVYLVHRRGEFRADAALTRKLAGVENIESVLHSVATEISGNTFVEGITVMNRISGESKLLLTDGVFVAIGVTPNNALAQGVLELNEWGQIITDANMRTSVRGVYAAGDIRSTPLKQIVTAAADGAVAAYAASAYIAEM